MIDKQELRSIFESTSLERPEDTVGFLLWRVGHRYQRDIDRACADVNLTHLQFIVLVISAWLGRGPDPVTQSNLSSFSGIHKMQVSAVLKALESKELVTRERHDSDERVKQVQLTPGGLATLINALPLVEAAQVHFFGPRMELGNNLHTALKQIVGSWQEEDD